ncbi:chemotaxis protein CheA [Sphingobium sp. B2]|uniref:chemotaxis protein CheA n=1 Tax=Sphingobium sp. B2 TaxID=2583228 RepID=UPI00119F1268|nr:chemotaxis protein CheA [Sphingobium sp. B2]
MSDFDDIQAIFFEECAEGLAVAEQGLSAMVAGDCSPDVVAGVFRAVHSIKGGSGAFGHGALLAFSHCFENALDEVRAGTIPANRHVAQIMLSALDVLADHVAAAQGPAPQPDDAAMLLALEELLRTKGAVETPSASPPPPALDDPATPDEIAEEEADELGFVPIGVDLAMFDDFESEQQEELEPIAAAPHWNVRFAPSREAMAHGAEPMLVVRELERMGAHLSFAEVDALPPLRELDPESAYVVWHLTLPGDTEESSIQECFDFVPPDSLVDISRAQGDPEAAHAPDGLIEPVSAPIAADRTEQKSADILSLPVADTARAPVVAGPNDGAGQTIRIDVAKLDMLLNLVGELVIRNSILSDRLAPIDQQRVELPQLGRLTREIQDNVMSLRAQPIRQAFSRVPRMLRELCAETGKQVALEIVGETVEVDKSVIEKIGDPLTHMIRNAIDHGIETPSERLALGKSGEGSLRVSAEQKGARIFIQVRDDGRGIDRDRVRAKAIERGLIAPDAQLTDEEVDNLICAPGFSTAETISNISGRGVGMDVVRSNVEALGGRIEISSEKGHGTSFTMVLPLTLAILDGMIIRLAGQRYVLPLSSVVESVQPEPGQVRSVTPTREVIELRGDYVPIKRLSDLFAVDPAICKAPEDSLVIIVESDSAGLVGLMVDTIEDRREVVIKSLDQHLYPIRGLGGATILGDGSIALIMDVDALVAPSAGTNSKFAVKGMAA